MSLFFIIFVVIPVIEITLFIVVGGQIGLGTTLLLALGTAILGGIIVRSQGLQTLNNLRNELSGNALPVKELFDGACLLIAGATLITPGFFTDFIGFMLLIPQVRDMIRSEIINRINIIQAGQGQYSVFRSADDYPEGPADPNIIDGEYEDLTPKSENQKDD